MLNLADFALQERLEGNLIVAISWAWYNGSYTMAAKPIKTLELHYTMIQFLINTYCIYHKTKVQKIYQSTKNMNKYEAYASTLEHTLFISNIISSVLT